MAKFALGVFLGAFITAFVMTLAASEPVSDYCLEHNCE